MTGFNHGMTGAVIALAVKEPELAVPLAFLSHFACDVIPHWDYGAAGDPGKLFTHKFNRALLWDFISGVTAMVIMGLLFPSDKWLIWACMIAAAIPDLTSLYYRFYIERLKKGKQKPFFPFFAKFHHAIQHEFKHGYYVEIAWFFLMVYLVSLFK
jgi:hypothetical protein